jgi:UDP-glucose 4-epimerase
MNELIRMVEEIAGGSIRLDRRDTELGDVGRTGGLTERANTHLGWQPQVTLREGLERQYEWHLARG